MTNTIAKVLRFSELTPDRIAKLNEFAVHVPNVDVSFVFRRITLMVHGCFRHSKEQCR